MSKFNVGDRVNFLDKPHGMRSGVIDKIITIAVRLDDGKVVYISPEENGVTVVGICNGPRKRNVRVHIYGDPSEKNGFFTTVGPVSDSKCPLLAVTEIEVDDEQV